MVTSFIPDRKLSEEPGSCGLHYTKSPLRNIDPFWLYITMNSEIITKDFPKCAKYDFQWSSLFLIIQTTHNLSDRICDGKMEKVNRNFLRNNRQVTTHSARGNIDNSKISCVQRNVDYFKIKPERFFINCKMAPIQMPLVQIYIDGSKNEFDIIHLLLC